MEGNLLIVILLLGAAALLIFLFKCSGEGDLTGTEKPEKMRVATGGQRMQTSIKNDSYVGGTVLQWNEISGDLRMICKNGRFQLKQGQKYEVTATLEIDQSKADKHAIVQTIMRTGNKEKIIHSSLFHDMHIQGSQVIRNEVDPGQTNAELYFRISSSTGAMFFKPSSNIVIDTRN